MAKKQITKVVENPNDWKLVHIMGHGKTRINEEEKSEILKSDFLNLSQKLVYFKKNKTNFEFDNKYDIIKWKNQKSKNELHASI